MALLRTFDWIQWACYRCHREVTVEAVELDITASSFVVRCPICDKLVRFLMPDKKIIEVTPVECSISIVRSEIEPSEEH